MIEAHELSKLYDDFLAVDRVNLDVPAGTVLALLGPNGAGKTTTVRMLTSILAPSAGSARVAGYDVLKYPEKVRASVGVLPEQHGLYERMKAVEYLDFFGRVYRLSAAERKKRSLDLMERFGLTFALGKKLGEYSKGMKQKLALVRAMLHDPPVLLLDEPTSAMDPQSAKLVRDAIIELQRDQRTFLITTHNLSEAQSLANRIAIIRHGRIIANGSFSELARRFAGEQIMELRVRGILNGFAGDLAHTFAGKLNIGDSGDDWVQYSVAEPSETNPQVIRHAVGSGVDIVSLAPISRTLEDIYLQVVKEDEAQGGAAREHLR
ncbi:MAG: ABC transporter ATP-binding protein [Anaerolineae bacterium]|nr:ABC transporter ATP-binding protein [Anaerolineae bacterium]NUQ03736.1 ABC transporter ATP-binding protein [Anaerolineae bacterium]